MKGSIAQHGESNFSEGLPYNPSPFTVQPNRQSRLRNESDWRQRQLARMGKKHKDVCFVSTLQSWIWNRSKVLTFGSGASYTATGFSITGTQPSSDNVLGNPNTYKGHTASNGPNFVMYLATKYNKSKILTYDFAWAGSPVPGVVGQIKDTFIPNYTGGAKLDPGWNPTHTLFACFVGINDLDHWNTAANLNEYRDGVFNQYTDALERVRCSPCTKLILHLTLSHSFTLLPLETSFSTQSHP